MEIGARRPMIDSTSRILSIVSLGVAICSIAYVFYQSRVTTPKGEDANAAEHVASNFETARQEMRQQLAAALDKQDERMENWNSQLTGAIQTFRQDGTALLTRLDEDARLTTEQLQETFREELAELAQQATPSDTSNDGGLNGPLNQSQSANGGEPAPTHAPDTVAANPVTGSVAPVNVARLKVVNTSLRPGAQDSTLIVIENEGDSDALIERISFRPESEFEISDASDSLTDTTTSSLTKIVYEPSDNTSTRAGYHGIYDRQLQERIRVPAGESLTLRVIIRDARYEGWGFGGRLALDYNGSERLVVEAARVTFRMSDT